MLRQTGVQDRTQLAQYNVCRLVDRLEREGLVERHQCRMDGRSNVLVITAKGRELRRARCGRSMRRPSRSTSARG